MTNSDDIDREIEEAEHKLAALRAETEKYKRLSALQAEIERERARLSGGVDERASQPSSRPTEAGSTSASEDRRVGELREARQLRAPGPEVDSGSAAGNTGAGWRVPVAIGTLALIALGFGNMLREGVPLSALGQGALQAIGKVALGVVVFGFIGWAWAAGQRRDRDA